MDVHVSHVPLSADRADVESFFASKLHAAPYTSLAPVGELINLAFVAHQNRRDPKAKHSGRGVLTVPIAAVGQLLLDRHGHPDAPEGVLVFGGETLHLRRNRFAPKEALQAELAREPYLAPAVRAQQDRTRAREANKRTALMRLHMGRQCGDGVFSSEWSRPRGTVELGFMQRSLLIRLDDTMQSSVSIPHGTIWRVFVDGRSDTPSALFLLACPAKLVRAGRWVDRVPPERISALDLAHAPVAPFVCSTILLSFASRVQLDELRMKLAVMRAPSVVETDIRIATRGLYGEAQLRGYVEWIRQLDWPVAFALDMLVRNQALDPVQLRDLRDPVQAAIGRLGVERVASALTMMSRRLLAGHVAADVALDGEDASDDGGLVVQLDTLHLDSRRRLIDLFDKMLSDSAETVGRAPSRQIVSWRATISPTSVTRASSALEVAR